MAKRSPRYPRINLTKAIELTRKLFDGAHQSRVDVDSAARVIGYAGSSGGAASSALGALRQYGLVDGLRGDVGVSELAMRILQPMSISEKNDALHEAATKPEIFERILGQFGEKLPVSDEPIRAFLIRQEGFSTAGAEEILDTLRATFSSLPELNSGITPPAILSEIDEVSQTIDADATNPLRSSSSAMIGELITLPLGQNCKAELRLIGEVTEASYARLIKHLELLREIAADEG